MDGLNFKQNFIGKDGFVWWIGQIAPETVWLDNFGTLDKALEGKKSKVAFIIHDEVVLDIADDEKYIVPGLKKIFGRTLLGDYLTNVEAGNNFGDMRKLSL